MSARDQLDSDRIPIENLYRLAPMHAEDDEVALRVVRVLQDHFSSPSGTGENSEFREVIALPLNLVCDRLMRMEFKIGDDIRQRPIFIIDDADDSKSA
ncbi:MAG: hypothetical protein QOE55_794 [Acidobacteriaceae bacterium]|nr:hypothetical protein [Acidobacteriaceae bacterium]